MVTQPGDSKSRSTRSNPSAREVQRVRDRYLRALIRGDEEEASEAILEAVSFDWRPSTIYMEVLAKALIAVGEMWHSGELSMAHEHQAIQVTLRQAVLLRQFFPPERKTGLHAIVSAVERDGHLLGAMIFTDLLFFDGWNTDFLGAGTPAEDLGRMVAERKPDLVALSVTLEGGMGQLEESVKAVREANESTFIVIGGVTVVAEPERSVATGADLVAGDPVQAVIDIGAHFDISGSTMPLEQILQRVGEQVRAKRIDRGWSQQQLADAAGLDRTYLSGVEHGKQNLTLGAVKKLGDALQAHISDFIT
ncbi:MAG: cobalamin-dependent protein [Chloroflexi bacterium]|nr:cobalamin-dependent protein [Chloroflexota bacterium]